MNAHDQWRTNVFGGGLAWELALPAQFDPLTLSLPSGTSIRCIGTLEAGGEILRIVSAAEPVALPEVLGHEHRGNPASPVAGRA